MRLNQLQLIEAHTTIKVFLQHVAHSLGPHRKYGPATLLLIALFMLLRLWKKRRGAENNCFWPNWPAKKYNEEAQRKVDVWSKDLYGSCFPGFTVDWRRYLYPGKTAMENVLTLLGTSKRTQYPLKKLVISDIVDLMQFPLRLRFTDHVHAGTFFSQQQLQMIAKQLLAEAQIPLHDSESKKKKDRHKCYDVVEYPRGQPIPHVVAGGIVGVACFMRQAARLLGLRSKTVTVLSHPERSSRLHYYERAGEGEIIVLLHGLLASAVSWFPMIPYLKGRRIIALDLSDFAFGFSRSNPPVSRIIDHTLVIEAFLREPGIIGPEGVTIVGHSFGGTIAWHIGRRLSCPRINRIVLMSPLCGQFAYTWAHCPIAVIKRQCTPEGVPKWMDTYLQRLKARLFHGPDSMNVGLANLFQEDHMTGFRPDGTPHKIKVPTLLLWGTENGDIPPRAPKYMLESFSLHCPHPLSQAFFIPNASNCASTTSLLFFFALFGKTSRFKLEYAKRIIDFMLLPPFVLRINLAPVCAQEKDKNNGLRKTKKERKQSLGIDLSSHASVSLKLMAQERPSCAAQPGSGTGSTESSGKKFNNHNVAGPMFGDLALPQGRLDAKCYLHRESRHTCVLCECVSHAPEGGRHTKTMKTTHMGEDTEDDESTTSDQREPRSNVDDEEKMGKNKNVISYGTLEQEVHKTVKHLTGHPVLPDVVWDINVVVPKQKRLTKSKKSNDADAWTMEKLTTSSIGDMEPKTTARTGEGGALNLPIKCVERYVELPKRPDSESTSQQGLPSPSRRTQKKGTRQKKLHPNDFLV